MDKTQQIPLAERLQGAGPRSMGLPVAMGLYAEDFLGLVGQMTGREEHYTESTRHTSSPMKARDGGGKSVRNIVVSADALPPAEKTTLLFRLLVEPFAALEYVEVSDK